MALSLSKLHSGTCKSTCPLLLEQHVFRGRTPTIASHSFRRKSIALSDLSQTGVFTRFNSSDASGNQLCKDVFSGLTSGRGRVFATIQGSCLDN